MNAPDTSAPDVPTQIAEMMLALCQVVTERLRIGAVTPEQVRYIVERVLGIRRRFWWLVTRIQAGKIPKERTRKPRAPRKTEVWDTETAGREPPRGWKAIKAKYERLARLCQPRPVWRQLGQTYGWLVVLAPAYPMFLVAAPAVRARLLTLLNDPEMRALLLASRRVGNCLRPLCWMMGIDASVLSPAPVDVADAAAAAVAAPLAEVVAEPVTSLFDPVTGFPRWGKCVVLAWPSLDDDADPEPGGEALQLAAVSKLA